MKPSLKKDLINSIAVVDVDVVIVVVVVVVVAISLLLFFVFFVSSVLRGHSFFSSPPQGPMTSDFEGFSYQIVSITFLSHLNSEKEPVFPFFNVECQTRELLVPFL